MNYQSQLDPQLRRIAKKVPYYQAMIPFANLYLTLSYRFTPIPKGITGKTIWLNGYQGKKFQVDIFSPAHGKETPSSLIYLHGGAFSYKASAYHKKLACVYAEKAGCTVFFPNYHLLPRYSYPAAYEDVLALYRWVRKHNSGRLGVAGDSAGASLTALLCNRCGQEGLEPPCLQMLVYPATDITMKTDSMKQFPDTPLWNAKNNKRMWRYYTRNLEDRYTASPMHSQLPQALPTTYIETAEYDCLHDEGILYGEKLIKAGAQVTVNETTGTIHGYDLALDSKVARENVEKRVTFLREAFTVETTPGNSTPR